MAQARTTWANMLRAHAPGIAAGVTLLALVGVLATGALAGLAGVALEAVLALAGLLVFAIALWRGASIFLVGPVLALLVLLAADPATAIAEFETRFARNAATFAAQFLPLFVMGAIFGKVLTESGCAEAMAAHLAARVGRSGTPLAVAGISALLLVSGVAVFIIAFSVYPIARSLHARVALPERLIPGAIAFGGFTFAMTAVPGAPSLPNIIAASGLGTTPFAGALAGLVATITMIVLGSLWLVRRTRGLGSSHDGRRDGAALSGEPSGHALLPFWLALSPLIVTIAAHAGLLQLLGRQEQVGLGELGPSYWAAVVALVLGTLTAAGLGQRRSVGAAVNAGATAAALPLLGTAVGLGFGATLVGFPGISAALQDIPDLGQAAALPGAVSSAAFYAAMVGSSSGGMALWLQESVPGYLAVGIPPETLHRIVALSVGVFDTLPHSAAIIALLAICRIPHRDCYGDIAVLTICVPALGLAAALLVL